MNDYEADLLVRVLFTDRDVDSRNELWAYLTARSLPEPSKARPPRKHGTTSSYAQHYKAGEKPCAECRAAHNAYRRSRNAARRRAA